ncbi:uncharacterized protein [Drosophila suzukii]|uniref:Retrovirus-related Pol polyprotein from type-1 retrotransposable element R1 n=1 Tax=Drosophila suzukii TaxID=28584 RepID=A0ABM4TXE5_DROSZ
MGNCWCLVDYGGCSCGRGGRPRDSKHGCQGVLPWTLWAAAWLQTRLPGGAPVDAVGGGVALNTAARGAPVDTTGIRRSSGDFSGRFLRCPCCPALAAAAAITESLTDLGVEIQIVELIHKLLMSRVVTSTLGISTQTRFVNRGTPQGGVLSPLLWNIAVNKLLCYMEGGGCKVVAYADDVAIIFSGKFPQTLCDLMTAKLEILSDWTTARGLGVNPSKTELVLFTNRYKIPQLNPPILNNCSLSFSDNARYLGLVLDKRLTWRLNSQERTRKATIALYSCKKAIGTKWGMSPKIVNWIHTAIVKPILLYGVSIWWPALMKQTTTTNLNKVQRMASLCISGALRTTPNEALNAILNLPSLDLAGMERAKIAAVRMRDLGQWKPQIYGHARILQQDTMIPPSTDLCKPIEYIHTPFEALLPTREDWEQGQPGPIEAVNFYNDGSKLNNQVGGGIYSEQLNIRKSFRLPDHCSVFQAEVFAIIEALMLLNDANCQNKLINIYSDSQAAIRSIISTNTNFHTISVQFKIYLIWVPGHRNITGNCIADERARHGTTVPLLPDKENIDMANHRREKNFGTIKTKPYRVRNGNKSVNRPLVGWHTRKQIGRAPKRFMQKLQGRGGRGNGGTPVLFLPGPEQI